MAQNTSSAVMQQRKEAQDSLDDFPTPPWATRGMLRWLSNAGLLDHGLTCREPAANRGYMVRPLSEHFGQVIASDVCDYGFGYPVRDYLFGMDEDFPIVDWTITNPPFRLAQQFIERALATSRAGVSMIVRSAFLEGAGRYHDLFSKTPPSYILQHVERVPMFRGRYDPNGTSATAYCWLIWVSGIDRNARPTFDWIAPCKRDLERADDVIEWLA